MTETEICNLALGMIGHDRTIAGDVRTATSTEAMRCRLFLDSARRSVLACGAPWVFAQAEFEIAARAAGGTPDWTDMPAEALHIIRIEDAASERPIDYDRQPFPLSVRPLPCDCDARPRIHYVRDVPDPNLWPPKPLDAWAAELAARLAPPMTADIEKARSARQSAAAYLSDAQTWNANQSGKQPPRDGRYCAARR